MNARDLTIVVLTALLTAGVVELATAPAFRAVATGDRVPAQNMTAPNLIKDRVSFSLKTGRMDATSGGTPKVTLRAESSADTKTAVEVEVRLMAAQPMTEMSRVMAMPRVLWSDRFLVTLNPREVKALALDSATAVAPGTDFFFVLQVGDQTLRAETPLQPEPVG